MIITKKPFPIMTNKPWSGDVHKPIKPIGTPDVTNSLVKLRQQEVARRKMKEEFALGK